MTTIPDALSTASSESIGPPIATLTRRAQSYNDFHHVARAFLQKENQTRKDTEHVKDELQFADWYGSVEDELLEAAHDEFK